MAFTTAFSQIRLSGTNVSTAGGRLVVGGVGVLTATDSGAFVSASLVAQTGQAAWQHGQNNALNLSGALASTGSTLGAQITAVQAGAATVTNVTSTGAQLGASIASLSGWAVATLLPKGAEQSFISGLISGSDTYAITFPTGFAGRPRVGIELEVVVPVIYGHSISQVTSAGFTLYLSDTLAETGCAVHVEARL